MYKKLLKYALPLLAACSLASCSDEGDLITPSYNDGAHFIAYNAADNLKGSHEVLLARSSAIELCQVEGVQPTDEFAARHKQTGELTFLKWGYKYAGLQGDAEGHYQRVYYNDTILIGLGFADNWRVADYDLLMLRGHEAQTLDAFHFAILGDVECDLSKVQGGVVSVKARGWDDPGSGNAIDSLQFIDSATGRVMVSKASDLKGDGTAYEVIAFPRDSFATGHYELWVKRWAQGLRQQLCTFSYFNYAFTDSDPMQRDAEGRYVLKFFVNEFHDGDTFTVADRTNKGRSYVERNVPFDAACFDESTHTYTYTLSDDCWRGEPENGLEFDVNLNIGGVRTNVSGTARI